MCGRFNVIDNPITQMIMDTLGIEFSITSNDNVCPSDLIPTVGFANKHAVQINANWGIKPEWSTKLLINAQSESVSYKKTFKQAFINNRCLVPCSGWYEWKTNQQGNKQKYLFNNKNNAMFMAAILYKNPLNNSLSSEVDLFGDPINTNKQQTQLVTLTTKANLQCEPIHSRMPLIIPPDKAIRWLSGDNHEINDLLRPDNNLSNLLLTKH